MAAAVYGANNKLKVLVLDQGLSHNKHVDGPVLFSLDVLKKEFANSINKKLLEFEVSQEVIALEKNVVSFSAETNKGLVHYAKSIVIASGQTVETGEGSSGFDLLTFKDPKGKIKVDVNMQTNIPGIFAAGSVTAALPSNYFVCAGQGAMSIISVLEFLEQK